MKSIKFKSIILDVAANHTSVVVTFPEKIAVFDARTLEDRPNNNHVPSKPWFVAESNCTGAALAGICRTEDDTVEA